MLANSAEAWAMISIPTDSRTAMLTKSLVRYMVAWSFAACATASRTARAARASLLRQHSELFAVGTEPGI